MRRVFAAWVFVVFALVVPASGALAFAPGTTMRVSTDSSGSQGNWSSTDPSISSDGRYVAFMSSSPNLVPADINGSTDIFVKDTLTGTTTRVSTDSSGLEGNGYSYSPSISADGRYVAFNTNSSNLVPGDTNGQFDVFVKDTLTGTTTRVSTDSSGSQGIGSTDGYNSISSDGRYVAFVSNSSNLVDGDTNGDYDVFVKDTLTGTTTRVSTDSSGSQGNWSSRDPSISSDGRYVAFTSDSLNLVAGDTNGEPDIFVKDTLTGTTRRVSTDSSGLHSNGYSMTPSISSDGRYVAFHSLASNLVAGDTNGRTDVFVKDTLTGTTTRVSTDSLGLQANTGAGGCWISPDGRYVAFSSLSSNLVAGDTNGNADVFVKDTLTGTTTRVSTDSSGSQGNGDMTGLLSISSGGRHVAFTSFASNLVAGDTNGEPDIFVKDMSKSGGVDDLTRVSTDSSGTQGNGDSACQAISGDGRYVAFSSSASNLVAGDTNASYDVFVKDTVTGSTRLVSSDSSGAQAQGNTGSRSTGGAVCPSISADGRYVAFSSLAWNLVAGDTNASYDVFLKDTVTGSTRLVSSDSSGAQAQGNTGEDAYPYVSADGRYVAFNSSASNLVAGDINGVSDAFVKDTVTGSTRLVSSDSSGARANGDSSNPSISADGRYVAFRSAASDLFAGDTNGADDIFVKDTVTGSTRLVSSDSLGVQANHHSSWPSISADGRYVAFLSWGSNLVASDINGVSDIFVKDTVTGSTKLVSSDSLGVQGNANSYFPSISADGRYVAYISGASNFVANDANGHSCDAFVKDTVTGSNRLISTDSAGTQANSDSGFPSISADGRRVAFNSPATNLVAGDTNGRQDVFVKDLSSSPTPLVPGSSATELPVIVLVAGLSSDTGRHAAPPALGQWQFGWKMNSGHVGGPWENYLATQAAADHLGAKKVLIAPTAAGVKSWPAAAAAGVIDSTGGLDDNTAKLVSWLRRPDIQAEIGDSPIIFIGHSYGGVIARSMLASNELPEGDPIRKQIAGIIQLASPNGGSPMADVALNAGYMGTLGDILNIFFPVRSDIMWQLRPSEMKSWNIQNPGRVEVPVYRIGGKYLPDALDAFGADWLNFTLSGPYQTTKAGMVAMNTIFGGIENDGIVSKKSIKNGDGSLDVEAWDFGSAGCTTRFPLAHGDIVPGVGQSPGGIALREVVPQSKNDPLTSAIKVDIMYIMEDLAAAGGTWSNSAVRPSLARAAVQSASAPAAEPLAGSVTLPVHTASVAAGGVAHVQLPLDGPATIFVSSTQGTPTVEVRDVGDAHLECPSLSTASTEGTITTMLAVSPREVGQHTFDISLPPGVSGEVTLAGVIGVGARFVVSAVEPAYAGAATTITASFESSAGVPLLGAHLTGSARKGEAEVTMTFTDDGAGADANPGDGVYTAEFTAPTSGRWTIHVKGEHATAERADDRGVDIGEALAIVDGPLVESTPDGPGDTFASFGVQVPLAVSASGTYTVSAMVTDESGARVGLLRTSAHLESGDTTALVPATVSPQLSGTIAHTLMVSPIRITRDTDGVELAAGTGPGLTTARTYASTDFYAFSISLFGPAPNPSPTAAVHFTGTALNTSSTVASVEYTIDGSATWHPVAASDGAFDSHSEDFAIDLSLPDYVYGILVRQTGADGTQLPVADWAGKRFTIDTVAPAKVADLAAALTTDTGSPAARTSWLPSDPPSDTASSVRYLVALEGAEAVTTYDTGVDIPLPDARVHTLSVTPIDEAGNAGPVSTATVDAKLADTTAPSTTLRSDPASNAAGWNKSSVDVSLDATDEPVGSGVEGTRYTVDENAATSYANGFSVASEGVHTIKYSSVDVSGNREDTRTATIRIDLTSPVTTSDATATYVGTATVKLTAHDGALSGVAKTEWRMDGASSWTSGTVAKTAMAGNHTVEFRSTDIAGNTEDIHSATFVVWHPSAITLTSKSNSSLGYGSAFTVTGTLKNGMLPLATQRVVLQSAAPGGAYSDTPLTATTTLSGGFTFSVKPTTRTFYRVSFAGSSGHAASESAGSVYATPKPSVGAPKAASKMSHSKSYTVFGYLKPKHTSGSYPVRIYKYRKVSGKWKSSGYVKAKASNYSSYTKYSVKLKLTKAGKWRLRAYAPADSGHATAWSSGYDYVTVK